MLFFSSLNFNHSYSTSTGDWPRNVLCHNADGSVTYIGTSDAISDKKNNNPELNGGSFFSTVDDDDEDESENGKNKVGFYFFKKPNSNFKKLIFSISIRQVHHRNVTQHPTV